MGSLCIRGKHGGQGLADMRDDPQHRRAGHSDADASFVPQVRSRDGDRKLTRAEVKAARDASPLSRQNNEADYPPPFEKCPGRRRSSVKRELDAAGPALRNLGDADYPPPMQQHGGGKTRKQVKQERDAAMPLSRVNQEL